MHWIRRVRQEKRRALFACHLFLISIADAFARLPSILPALVSARRFSVGTKPKARALSGNSARRSYTTDSASITTKVESAHKALKQQLNLGTKPPEGKTKAPRGRWEVTGGGGGIRTLVTRVTGKTVFETAAFNHSATPPQGSAASVSCAAFQACAPRVLRGTRWGVAVPMVSRLCAG